MPIRAEELRDSEEVIIWVRPSGGGEERKGINSFPFVAGGVYEENPAHHLTQSTAAEQGETSTPSVFERDFCLVDFGA